MILLAELQCKDWEHNRVNSGIIKQIRKAFPNEHIKLYAEARHINNLRNILDGDGIELEFAEIEFYDWRQGNQYCKSNYAKLIEQIIRENENVREIVLLSCNKGIVLGCDIESRQYPQVTFHLVLHAAAEEICHYQRQKKKDKVWRMVSNLRHFGKSVEPVISMKDCMEKCCQNNCKFIIFSPNYRSGLKEKLNDEILDKITFLHHPFFDSRYEKENVKSNKVKVGIYGQAVNQNALEIIRYYNLHYDNDSVTFQVMAKADNEIFMQKNVVRLFDKDYVCNKELEHAISEFDFILIPYDKSQYIVTASGILCDAVSQEIPLLMLDSPYFEYYNNYEIGILCKDIASMAKRISELFELENVEHFREMDKKLKKVAFEKNVNTLKEVLKVC